MPSTDKKLTCVDCGNDFNFSAGEQQFYDQKGLSAPKRCKDCRAIKRQQKQNQNG